VVSRPFCVQSRFDWWIGLFVELCLYLVEELLSRVLFVAMTFRGGVTVAEQEGWQVESLTQKPLKPTFGNQLILCASLFAVFHAWCPRSSSAMRVSGCCPCGRVLGGDRKGDC